MKFKSKADELFEKLRYRKIEDYNVYKNRRGSHIYFNNFNKTVDVCGHHNNNKILTMKQIEAINEKIKELGWNDVNKS